MAHVHKSLSQRGEALRPVTRRWFSLLAVLALAFTGVTVLPSVAQAASVSGNDDRADVYRISGFPFVADQSTRGASVESGEPLGCYNMGATVWYRFVLPERGILTIDVRTGGYDSSGQYGGEFVPDLAVYSGTDPSRLTRVGCETGVNATNVGGADVAAGTYWIQVGGEGGSSGQLHVEVDHHATGGSTPTSSGAVLVGRRV